MVDHVGDRFGDLLDVLPVQTLPAGIDPHRPAQCGLAHEVRRIAHVPAEPTRPVDDAQAQPNGVEPAAWP